MLARSRAIVLRKIAYSDSSIIVTLFSELNGTQAVIVQGLKGKTGRSKRHYFQPLSLVEVVYYHKESHNLSRLKEVRFAHTPQHIPFEPDRSAIAFFISEVLYKSLKETPQNKPLFDFLYHAITWLDTTPETVANFHLFLLAQTARYLGFKPTHQEAPIFDLMEGEFTSVYPLHKHFVDGGLARVFGALFPADLDDVSKSAFTRQQRRALLNTMILYYRLHVHDFGEVKSLDVLESVFD